MLGTEVCATELRRRVSAGNIGVCNRAEEKGECWEQRCVQQSCGEGWVLGTEVCATELWRRVCAGNRGVCNRAEEKGVCWEQRCVQQS